MRRLDAIAEIPNVLLTKAEKTPTQITFVIAYSCTLDSCNIREAIDALESSGEVKIIDAAFQYADDDDAADATGLVTAVVGG